MTIVAGAACPEGVVVTGDSRSSVLVGGSAYRTSTYFARKVFSIDDRFIGATFGWATLEGKTISGHIRDFDQQVNIVGDVMQAAHELTTYFNARLNAHIAAGYDPAPAPGLEPLGLMLGGYEANGVGRLLRVWPWSGTVMDVAQTTNPGGGWNGETDVMTRLVKGYGETHERGWRHFSQLLGALPALERCADGPERLSQLCEAALADEEGRALAAALARLAPAP